MSCVFASDLHLSATLPAKVSLFKSFINHALRVTETVYLLGDVFEIWLGDDDDSGPNDAVVQAMRQFTNDGGKLFVMSGNRDFLLGSKFAEASGATLLPDWHIIEVAGEPTLLTHGDLLCTKDVEYQKFRRYVRDPDTQATFLALPLDERRKVAANMRSGTQASMLEKDEFIMDVEQATVEQFMREHCVTRLIHGHTHRSATHTFELDGIAHERIVLGDWYDDDCSIIVGSEHSVRRMSATAFVNNS